MNKRKIQLLQLISVGLIIIALSQIIWHYLELSDFYKGASIGIGFGLMLLAILKIRKNSFAKT
ncbi:hypothetical protein [Gillisia sp. CAL575]|uniref:hypothetical protein n=1 Tax=Gillisia sp. CAL575 TaxID=985255 RepID=UPI0003A67704|nr:hypothetical protein [Gillisia sp. CAL575]